MALENYNILSLDQSTAGCGWCIFKGDRYHSSGVFYPKHNTYEKKMFEVFKFIEFKVKEHKINLGTTEGIWLNERTETTKTGNYYKSDKNFGDNLHTYKVLGELLGACKMSLIGVGVKRVMEISPSSWKSHFKILGKGIDRDKQKRLAIIYARQISEKFVLNSDDEADAICQGKYAVKEFFNMEEKLANGEFKVLMEDKIHSYPHVFTEWQKKDYNTVSRHLKVKVEKEEKVIIGKSASGKNKWGKAIKEYYCDELKSLSKDLKIQFLEKIIDKKVKINNDYYLGTQMVKKQLELICNKK